MRPFWVIVFLLVVVSRIVSMLIERANKKQQEQRMRQAGARRQPQEGAPQAQQRPAQPRQQMATQQLPPAQPQHRPQATAGRGQDPAARRKAQLDELRRRRQGRATVGPAPAPPRTPAPAPTRRPPVVTKAASRPAPQSQVRPTPFAVKREHPSAKARPMGPSKQAAPPPAPIPAVTHRAPQPSAAAPITASQRQADGAYRLGAGHRPNPGFRAGQTLLGLEGGPAALRRMVILKEILDPPLALRE